jgi:hypothetical protein
MSLLADQLPDLVDLCCHSTAEERPRRAKFVPERLFAVRSDKIGKHTSKLALIAADTDERAPV